MPIRLLEVKAKCVSAYCVAWHEKKSKCECTREQSTEDDDDEKKEYRLYVGTVYNVSHSAAHEPYTYENEKRRIVDCGVWNNNNNRHLILSADVRAPSSKCKSNFKSLPLVGCSRQFCIILYFFSDVSAAIAAFCR